MTIREAASEKYEGPDFAVIKALGPNDWEVKSYLTGKRVGVYPTSDSARRIAKNFDDLALKDYLKELKKKRKKGGSETAGKYAKDKLTRAEVQRLDAKLRPLIHTHHAKHMVLCGSYRRGKEIIGDVDYVVTNADLETILAVIQNNFKTLEVSRQGQSVMTVVVEFEKKEAQLEFMNIKEDELGSAMLHATGSGEFNQGMRAFAKGKGLLLNQHGLFIAGTKKKLAGKAEYEIFEALGLGPIMPDRRSDPWPVLKKEFMKDPFKNAQTKPKVDSGKSWTVKSKSDPNTKYYVMRTDKGKWTCTCPHYRFRRVECKHIVFVKKEKKIK